MCLEKSADKSINSQSFARVNHCCNNLIKAAEHMVKDGLLERNVMLTENGNNTSMDDKPSEYEASLLQLAVRIEKNQKREEAQRVEAARDKIDKATRLTAKQTESSDGSTNRQRTETVIQLVHVRVHREEAGRKCGYAFDSDDLFELWN